MPQTIYNQNIFKFHNNLKNLKIYQKPTFRKSTVSLRHLHFNQKSNFNDKITQNSKKYCIRNGSKNSINLLYINLSISNYRKMHFKSDANSLSFPSYPWIIQPKRNLMLNSPLVKHHNSIKNYKKYFINTRSFSSSSNSILFSSNDNSKSVLKLALYGNLTITFLKFIVWSITKSPSMFAEFAHTAVDSINQVS